jgi:hypothetical protein
MMIAIAFGISCYSCLYLFSAWLGRHWRRTKSPNELHMLTVTEDRSGPLLTGAKMNRDIVRHPRRHLLIGSVSAVVAVLAWSMIILGMP